jgi:hypothetical protein
LHEFAEGTIGTASAAPSTSATLSVSLDVTGKRNRDDGSDEETKSKEAVSSLPSSWKDTGKGIAATPLRTVPPKPKKARVDDFELVSS